MLTVLLSGAKGFIGRALAASLTADGHRVVRLSRGARGAPSVEVVPWDPEAGRVDDEALRLARPFVVVNLAGEPISERWTAVRKRRILDSRVNGTTALAAALAALPQPPRVFISGSAIGYYGAHRGDELLTEASSAGEDYLARVAAAWERATDRARDAGIRVVHLRMGIVLGPHGGALAKMLPPFRLGAGGPMGNGRQWMSWISLTDSVRAIRFCMDRDVFTGPVNIVAPAPEQNAAFARTLGHVLHRPAVLPVPAFALRIAFGEMADHTILASQRVSPARLAGAGFRFQHPRLEDALAFELRRSDGPADH